MKKITLLLSIAVFNLYANSEYIPIQERSQGQSLTGSSLLNDSIFSNPASSSFTYVYSMEANYALPRSFAASILDTKTSFMGGGLGYFRRSQMVDGLEQVMQGMRLALSTRIAPTLGVGITGKMSWNSDAKRWNDIDMGVLWNISPVQIGAMLRNVAGGDLAFDQKREWAFGFRINYQETVFFSGNIISPLNQFRPSQYGVGVEYVSPYYFSLKGGWRILSDTTASYWSGGASLNTPKLSVHYAAEFPNQPSENVEHILGLSMLF